MFKFNNKLLPANFDNYCIKEKISYEVFKNNFFLPGFNSKIGNKSLSYQGSKFWSKLPLCLKAISYFEKKL